MIFWRIDLELSEPKKSNICKNIYPSNMTRVVFDVEFSTLDSSSPHIISGMSPCALGVRGVDARGPETLSSISIEVSDMLLLRS